MERQRRILVVDDEAPNRELLEALLTGFGHSVEVAADGSEALGILNASHDLVMLDVMMPGIDGFEVARRIRGDPAVCDVPVCMVTALTGREERLRAVEIGVNDFISKPIDKMELRVRTDSLLKMKEARDVVKEYQATIEEQNRVLEQSFEQLRKLGVQRDEFIGMASHDLKNPLSCILGFAAIIKSSCPPGAVMTEEMHGWVSKIVGHCRVMQKIIEDFLDFQALEDGEIKLTLEAVDINELASDALQGIAGSAATKGITTHLELEGGPLLINADRDRVNQVFENYVGNAVKFSSRAQRVTVCTQRSEKGVLVEVRDTGPGITDDDMKKLFVKYAKLSNAPTGGEKSSGLGLAICKRVVELHGGKTGARNNPEGGATFWFELPQDLKPLQRKAPRAEDSRPEAP